MKQIGPVLSFNESKISHYSHYAYLETISTHQRDFKTVFNQVAFN
jgi:hypothetical protein